MLSPCKTQTISGMRTFLYHTELRFSLDVRGCRFIQVSCTCRHALALSTGDALFSWGLGHSGQLGHGSTDSSDMPRRVPKLERGSVLSVAAGQQTSLALARNGEMWSWGTGLALGHGGNDESQQLLPRLVEGLPPGASITRITAGGNKAACVRADGTALSWGKFDHDSALGTSTPALLEVAPGYGS